MRAAFFCTFVLLGACGSPSMPSAGDDLRAVVRFLEDSHPAPHRYVSPDALAAVVDEEAARLDALEAPDDLEVGLSLHRVLAPIGDGHLAVAIPRFQPGASEALSLLPVVPIRIGGRTLIDASTEPLPPGTELVAIDGVSAETLYASLAPLALVDGARPDAQRRALERAFARYYHLAYGMRPAYRIRVRLPDGEERERSMAGVGADALGALSRERRSAPWRGPAPDPAEPPWPFIVRIEGGAVLLRLPSFGIADDEEYRRRVDALFAQIEPDATLVIDLRGNEGGLRTHGIAVLNHVLDAPYAQWARMEARVRRIPDPHRDAVTFPFQPEEALAARFPSGALTFDGDPLASRMVPVGDGHRGRVVVFVDGATNSAAVEMVAALRAARDDVTLVGTETGGECGRHIGEMPVVYTTRATGFAVLTSLIALTHVATDGCQPGRGFVPDVPVEHTERHFLDGVDPYLDAL